MSWTLGIALFFIIWWTMLFAVLPFGVRTQAEAGEIVQGTPESAPHAPDIRKIALITTGLACVVFALVWLAIRYQLIPLDTGSLRPGG
jgi:predicted secreted protein